MKNEIQSDLSQSEDGMDKGVGLVRSWTKNCCHAPGATITIVLNLIQDRSSKPVVFQSETLFSKRDCFHKTYRKIGYTSVRKYFSIQTPYFTHLAISISMYEMHSCHFTIRKMHFSHKYTD